MKPLLPVALLLLNACAARQHVTMPSELFDDAAFGTSSVAASAEDILSASEPMKQYARDVIAPRLKWQTAHAALIDVLADRSQLKLTYDAETTRTASEAFEARAGNCMSLVLMTAAFARELGSPFRFLSVRVDESWGHEGDLLMFAGHVNIRLGPGAVANHHGDLTGESVLVDFLPSADLRRQKSAPIDEPTILAMFMNNKAVEALAEDKLDEAYAWARAAVRQNAAFVGAQNTLGVVYLRHGQPERAEAVFRFALEQAPTNPHALRNLAAALNMMHREREAAEVAKRLAALEPTPFAEYTLGQKALRAGELERARHHFERALRGGGDAHELHFALAQVLVKQGDVNGAAQQLELAEQTSGTKGLQALYARKLERLKAH